MNDKYIVTTVELSEIIGKSVRRINQFENEGVLLKQSKGKWDLAENAKRYIAFLENDKGGTEDLEIKKLQAEAEYKRHQADTAALELAELKGDMHRSFDVEEITSALVLSIRNALLSIPGRIAVDVTSAKTPAEAANFIKAAINETLEELSSYAYDPNEYKRRVINRKGWKARDGN